MFVVICFLMCAIPQWQPSEDITLNTDNNLWLFLVALEGVDQEITGSIKRQT
jgi:hypothetical protein